MALLSLTGYCAGSGVPRVSRGGDSWITGMSTPREVIVPRSYPAEFRRKVLDLVEAGRPVAKSPGS